MKFNLGDYDLGDLGLGDFSLGDLSLGDFNLGDFNLGDFDLIPFCAFWHNLICLCGHEYPENSTKKTERVRNFKILPKLLRKFCTTSTMLEP